MVDMHVERLTFSQESCSFCPKTDVKLSFLFVFLLTVTTVILILILICQKTQTNAFIEYTSNIDPFTDLVTLAVWPANVIHQPWV